MQFYHSRCSKHGFSVRRWVLYMLCGLYTGFSNTKWECTIHLRRSGVCGCSFVSGNVYFTRQRLPSVTTYWGFLHGAWSFLVPRVKAVLRLVGILTFIDEGKHILHITSLKQIWSNYALVLECHSLLTSLKCVGPFGKIKVELIGSYCFSQSKFFIIEDLDFNVDKTLIRNCFDCKTGSHSVRYNFAPFAFIEIS